MDRCKTIDQAWKLVDADRGRTPVILFVDEGAFKPYVVTYSAREVLEARAAGYKVWCGDNDARGID